MSVALAPPTPALINALNDDAPLIALATGLVWEDPAPQDAIGAERIKVVVKLQTGRPERTGDGGRHMPCFYSVQAVGPASLIGNIRLAAKRIDTIFEHALLVLTGYKVMGSLLDEAIERTEPEPGTGVRWEWRGGIYQLTVAAV